MAKVLWVFLGGGIGSCLRYFLSLFIQQRAGATFPWGTFVVNVSGAFVIGVFMAGFMRFDWTPEWRLILAWGVLGGYTTFSTLAYEAVQLTEGGNFGLFGLYFVGTSLLGLVACWMGMAAMRAVVRS